jgi:hypothetical protein
MTKYKGVSGTQKGYGSRRVAEEDSDRHGSCNCWNWSDSNFVFVSSWISAFGIEWNATPKC